MMRPDNLGALPFSDYADPDPHGQMRLGDEAADWEPGDTQRRPPHQWRESRREPGWCGVCGASPLVHPDGFGGV